MNEWYVLVTGGRFGFFVQIGFIFSLTGSLDAIMYGGITSTPSSCKNDLEYKKTPQIMHVTVIYVTCYEKRDHLRTMIVFNFYAQIAFFQQNYVASSE